VVSYTWLLWLIIIDELFNLISFRSWFNLLTPFLILYLLILQNKTLGLLIFVFNYHLLIFSYYSLCLICNWTSIWKFTFIMVTLNVDRLLVNFNTCLFVLWLAIRIQIRFLAFTTLCFAILFIFFAAHTAASNTTTYRLQQT
jgi:hypothetical protein